jgi:hypothetical protein
MRDTTTLKNTKQNTKMKTLKTIKGGKRGFITAVDDAFRHPVHNTAVRYSHARGFHMESGLLPADDDVLWEGQAFYWANSGRRSLRPRDYAEIREEILSSD